MKAIVSADINMGIGFCGDLLKKLRGDMEFFRSITMGKLLVMGRKTYESLPEGGLPGRELAVLSKNSAKKAPFGEGGVKFFTDPESLRAYYGAERLREAIVAGGEEVYRLFLEDCDTVYITKIYGEYKADRHFPDLDKPVSAEYGTGAWEKRILKTGEEGGISYTILEYTRVGTK